jgi:hypothetical protein
MSEPEPFALCPVHRDSAAVAEAVVIWDGSSAVLAGPAYAVGLTLQRMFGPDVEISYSAVAYPHLTPAHPHNFIVMPVDFSDTAPAPDFIDCGNGSFLIPQGSRIEKSARGICVYNPATDGHDYLSAPGPGLN